MSQTTAPNSESIERDLCKRLESIRLMKNISQATLAETAGVSRRTIGRMESGEGVSLDTFLRVMIALDLTDHLAALLPDSAIRPIELADRQRQRKNASSPRKPKTESDGWQWGDES